jgi:hypothetical protein
MENFSMSILGMGIQSLRIYGSVAPVAFIFHQTEITIHMMDFSDKDLALEILREICIELNAEKVIIMTEAFMSSDLNGVCPSMAADKEECIIITGEDVNGDSYAMIQPFCRDERGMLQFKDIITEFKVYPLGRLSNILRDKLFCVCCEARCLVTL